MIRDTFFSFSRFGKLVRKEMQENWKLYALRFLVMYAVMTIVLVWNSYTDYSSFTMISKTDDLNVHIFTLVIWMWSWYIFTCLGVSFAFGSMKSKAGRITMLMNPATAFEKFFFRWLIYVLILPILIFFSIWLADYTRVVISSVIYKDLPFIETTNFKWFIDQGDGGYSLCNNWENGSLLILAVMFVQSLFFLGSIIWPKNSFIKSLTCFLVIVFLFYAVIMVTLRFSENSTFHYLTLFLSNWGHLLFLALSLLNWTLVYFRLKESEVIHRM